jgi:hypothetical protein
MKEKNYVPRHEDDALLRSTVDFSFDGNNVMHRCPRSRESESVQAQAPSGGGRNKIIFFLLLNDLREGRSRSPTA